MNASCYDSVREIISDRWRIRLRAMSKINNEQAWELDGLVLSFQLSEVHLCETWKFPLV